MASIPILLGSIGRGRYRVLLLLNNDPRRRRLKLEKVTSWLCVRGLLGKGHLERETQSVTHSSRKASHIATASLSVLLLLLFPLGEILDLQTRLEIIGFAGIMWPKEGVVAVSAQRVFQTDLNHASVWIAQKERRHFKVRCNK